MSTTHQLQLLDGRHVDHDTSGTNFPSVHSLECVTGILGMNNFAVWKNIVIGTKVKHCLRLGNATDQRSFNRVSVSQKEKGRKEFTSLFEDEEGVCRR